LLLVNVDTLKLLPVVPGGAILAGFLADDGAHGLQSERHFLRNVTTRPPGAAQALP
jgi:hypothetical protein